MCSQFWKEQDEVSIDNYIREGIKQKKIEFRELKGYKECKMVFENNTLKMNNKSIYYFDEFEHNGNKLFVLKAFNNEDGYYIQGLTIAHISELENNIVFVKIKDNVYLFIIIDNSIITSYSTIEDRRERYYTRKIHIECFENTAKVDNIINTSQKFKGAIEVLKCHYYQSSQFKNDNEIKYHLINWLRLFSCNEEYVRVLIDVIAAHQKINPDWIHSFISEISKLQNNRQHILFTIKTWDDANGLQRLLYNNYNDRQIIDRISNFKNEIMKIDRKHNTNKILTILSEIGISGKQMENGLIYYMQRPYSIKNGKKYLKEEWEKYYEIGEEELGKFRENLMTIKHFKFILLAYTEKFRNNVETFISKNISNKAKISFYPKKPNLKYQSCIFPNNNIKNKHKTIFNNIMSDKTLLKKIFNLTENIERKYDESRTLKDMNLLVRFNSVPKKACMLFTLQPKNDVKPLFNHIKE